MTELEDFLETIPSKNTKRSYKNGIKRMEEFLGYSLTKLIKSPEASKQITKFYSWLKNERRYSQNTCRNLVNGPVQFLKYFGTEIKLRKSLGIYRSEFCLSDHLLTIDEVQRMASLANLREQVILEVLLLGLRVSDASRLERKDFDRLNEDPPVPLRIYAKKEGTIYRTYISAEFQELLRLYLPTIEKETKYLLPGKRKGSHIDNDILNLTLQQLAEKAQVKLNGNLRWHTGRKLVLRSCAELGINQWSAKALTGKSISKDMATYLEGLDLKKDFLKLHSVLKLKHTKESNRVGDVEKTVDMLKETLTTLEKENMVLKTRIDNLQSNTMNLEDRLNDIGDFVAHKVEFGPYTEAEKEAVRRKFNIREFPEEKRQLMHDYNEIAMDLQKAKGYLDEKDMVELKKRFKARLKKREKAKKKGNI